MLRTMLIVVVLFFAVTQQGESAAPSQAQAETCVVGGPLGPNALSPLNDNRTACGVHALNPLVG